MSKTIYSFLLLAALNVNLNVHAADLVKADPSEAAQVMNSHPEEILNFSTDQYIEDVSNMTYTELTKNLGLVRAEMVSVCTYSMLYPSISITSNYIDSIMTSAYQSPQSYNEFSKKQNQIFNDLEDASTGEIQAVVDYYSLFCNQYKFKEIVLSLELRTDYRYKSHNAKKKLLRFTSDVINDAKSLFNENF